MTPDADRARLIAELRETAAGQRGLKNLGLLRRAADLLAAEGWRNISTAPKEPDKMDLTPMILLGFAPDEENYSPPSREGYWDRRKKRWVSTLDPGFDGPQPTHWRPLPSPPGGRR